MKRTIVVALLVLASLAVPHRAAAQSGSPAQLLASGSPHGVELAWSAAQQGTDPFTIAGYIVLRCTGASAPAGATCSLTGAGTWTQVTPAAAAATNYLDPAAGLSTSTTYSYVVQTVDTSGNKSAWSNIATVAIPSSFPSNPGAPTNLTAAVQ